MSAKPGIAPFRSRCAENAGRDLVVRATSWFVYLLECCDGSVYTGIATDVAARFAVHASGKGARYTRSHPPLRVLGSFEYPDRSSALKAELAIKRLSPREKRALCRAQSTPDDSAVPA